MDVHPFCASATVLIRKNVDEFAIADAQLFYEFFQKDPQSIFFKIEFVEGLWIYLSKYANI